MEQRNADSETEGMESREENAGNAQVVTDNIEDKADDIATDTTEKGGNGAKPETEDGKDATMANAEDGEKSVRAGEEDSKDVIKAGAEDSKKGKKADSKKRKKAVGKKAKKTDSGDIVTGKTKDNRVDTTDTTEDGNGSTGEKEENSEECTEITEATEKAGKAYKKKILILAGIFLVLTAVCCCVYSVIAFSYRDKFLPGTWINGIDCAELDSVQVTGLLQDQLQTYYLEVTGRDYASGALETLLGQVTAEDIHLTYSGDSRETVGALLAEQNVFMWLYRKLSDDTYSYQLSQGVSYDEEQLKSIVKDWEACRINNMTAPQDAYISECAERQKGYEIIPEVEGTKFDVQKLLELMDAAILSQETSLDLEAEGCYEEPKVRQDSAELTEPVETVNKWLSARITYDWNGTEIIIDRELIRDWITMEKDGPVLDQTAVEAFVKVQAEENDTYGKRRNFVTTLGVELSLPSGYYGWLTDKEAETEALMEAVCQGKTVSREPVYASSARRKGVSDIGNSYVEVDLTHQHLYLYEDGSIIFETDFVSGSMSSTPDCVTPEGVFGISYKTTNAVLRGANYETPVNYWMPFYGNYGLHDATWRSEFGGQIYIENGSHGCVNLPLDAAATIYGHMSAGFPVICYYYQVDPLADQYVEEEWNDDSDDEEE